MEGINYESHQESTLTLNFALLAGCIMLSDADVAPPRILGVTKNGATIAIPIDLPAAG